MIPVELHQRHLDVLLDPIAPLLRDAHVSEIMVNGPASVWAERAGRIERTPCIFESTEDLEAALRAIAQFMGRPLGPEHPILEGRLPDGSRVEAVLASVASGGPVLCIRRFARTSCDFDALRARGTLCSASATVLARAVEEKRNILVSGGTGSGKTSLLNALSTRIDPAERVVVIEDARELQLAQPHVVQLEARPPDAKGRGEVSVRQLLRATLRLRPDRIVIGEIRGGEAFDLVQAMTSGHGGCLGTVHASHPRGALARVETLALMSDVGLPLAALRAQVASAIDLVAQLDRDREGRRRVTDLRVVDGLDERGDYRLGPPVGWSET